MFVDRNPLEQVWQLSNRSTGEAVRLPLAYEQDLELVFDGDGCACIAASDAEPMLVDEVLGQVLLQSLDDSQFLARREENRGLIVVAKHSAMRREFDLGHFLALFGPQRVSKTIELALYRLPRQPDHPSQGRGVSPGNI